MQKEGFPRIHDRFIRDQEFRYRIIENHRVEDVCRRWDALADEDHTHIWPRKNTSTTSANGGFNQISKVTILCHWGIDLISSRHCLPCNDSKKKQEKNHRCVLTLTNTNSGRHAVHQPTWWNWQGSWWTPKHSESQDGDAPRIEWTGRPVTCSIFPKIRRQKTFMNSMFFVTDWSFTADGGLL